MRPVVLFRAGLAEESEMEICKKYFPVITQRHEIQAGDFVIPRYSCLPYYEELEADIVSKGATIINSHRSHQYIADLKNWYLDLQDVTPKTWFTVANIPEEGPFVLKGATNSKKHQWNTHMFAEDKKAAIEVMCKLQDDGLIGMQDIYAREYVPLRKFGDGVRGLPITEEYRFFVYNETILAGGFYWSEHAEEIQEAGFDVDPDEVPNNFLKTVMTTVPVDVKFYVIDVARTQSGKWVVIELNDAQMSGLSDVDPDTFYSNLKLGLAKFLG